MNKITHKELIEQLNTHAGVTFVSCSMETNVRMNKGGRGNVPVNPYFGEVTKQSEMSGAVGFDYENSVNLQRDRENVNEQFNAHQRKWGRLIEGNKFVEHKDNYYLQMKVENVKSDITYIYNDNVIDKSEFETWLPKKSESRQGVKREVIIRDVKLDNIRTIKFGGEEYRLVK